MQRVTHPVFFSWDMCDLRGPIILSTAFVFSIQNFSGHVSSGVASTSRWSRQTLQTRRALPAAAQVAS
jgi:hypothetical protein